MTRLLDINAMLALVWPQHQHYSRMERWVLGQSAQGKLSIATCPITQLGFVRISMNVKGYAADFESAVEMLKLLIDDEGFEHEFWPDDCSIDSLDKSGPRPLKASELTDSYLAGLAASRHGKLLTLDTGIRHRSIELVPE